MSKFHFNSPFQQLIRESICQKQSLGYKYDSSARTLYKFDLFCLAYGCTEPVLSKTLILAWIQKRPNESLATLKNRACVVRQLALYITRLGIYAYVLPYNSLPKVPEYTPYIFSNKELATFFKQTDACHYCSWVPHRHQIMPLLFRLLYGCGLRISEALNLRIQDVNLQTGVLTINDGKFNKDRLVPMSKELVRQCVNYTEKVHLFVNDNTYFFPGQKNYPMSIANAYKNFRKFLWQAHISHGGWGKGPRIHDFRHTFAVHCLRNWVINKKDLAAYLPVLKTYLGHHSFSDTAKYLRLTAELYPDITAKVEKTFGHVIPVIEGTNHATD